MKTIYLDKEFRCSATETETTVQSVETDFFDGKCPEYIEGYRFVLAGETRTRADGVEFSGEMVSPWVDSRELETVQAEHERHQLALTQEALNIAMGVTT